MKFDFHGLSEEDFASWVAKVKASDGNLSRDEYLQLEEPSIGDPVSYYGQVDPTLYYGIFNRCVEPGQTCMEDMMYHSGHGKQEADSAQGHDAHAGHDAHGGHHE